LRAEIAFLKQQLLFKDEMITFLKNQILTGSQPVVQPVAQPIAKNTEFCLDTYLNETCKDAINFNELFTDEYFLNPDKNKWIRCVSKGDQDIIILKYHHHSYYPKSDDLATNIVCGVINNIERDAKVIAKAPLIIEIHIIPANPNDKDRRAIEPARFNPSIIVNPDCLNKIKETVIANIEIEANPNAIAPFLILSDIFPTNQNAEDINKIDRLTNKISIGEISDPKAFITYPKAKIPIDRINKVETPFFVSLSPNFLSSFAIFKI
jgi:hypothetical protein